MSKFYAVARGKKIGIFNSWEETEKLVKGFSQAKYKSFKTLNEAQKYLLDVGVRNEVTDVNVVIPVKNDVNNSTPVKNEDEIIVYSDGSCVKKVGGYGYVVIYENSERHVSGKVPFYPTTNQVAELYAIYSLIYYIQNTFPEQKNIVINTDSKYSIGCLTDWCKNWVKNGWINSKNEDVANKELIKSILEISRGMNIIYKHVKAHNGDKYNEIADKLANEGRSLNAPLVSIH